MTVTEWDGRIRRAENLAERYEFAREALRFYRALAEFQRNVYLRIAQNRAASSAVRGSWPTEPDWSLLRPAYGSFLEHITRISPPPLAVAAKDYRAKGEEALQEILVEYWNDPPEDSFGGRDADIFLSRGLLQPYAEWLSARLFHPPVIPPSLCPVCNRRPQGGVLRPEGDGGKRFLFCSLCSCEWEFRRIYCPNCGEDDEKKLCVYIAPEFPHARVEACDSCRTYIKTIDLTKDGLAVPIVDEIALIPLDLWAQSHDYQKVERNLLLM
jgi:formate dehydrogenase formation protein